ncbi:hypothetical protein WG908_04470 [Sphingobium sp. AN641]|uniref:hypothetical protein n=1 Tax=Sphingobium sp. AN641 TaxID=3133443 RepID=UPI0030C2A2A7
MARQSHLDFVLTRWANLPDRGAAPASGARSISAASIPLTPEMSRQLRAELGRVAGTPAELLAKRDDVPRGLNGRIVKGWVYREVKAVDAASWNFVIALLAQTPDKAFARPISGRRNMKAAPGRIVIPDKDRAALQAHRNRTGAGGAIVLNGATDKPPGLSLGMIAGWLSGRTRTADPAHIRYVLKRYARLPDNIIRR